MSATFLLLVVAAVPDSSIASAKLMSSSATFKVTACEIADKDFLNATLYCAHLFGSLMLALS